MKPILDINPPAIFVAARYRLDGHLIVRDGPARPAPQIELGAAHRALAMVEGAQDAKRTLLAFVSRYGWLHSPPDAVAEDAIELAFEARDLRACLRAIDERDTQEAERIFNGGPAPDMPSRVGLTTEHYLDA